MMSNRLPELVIFKQFSQNVLNWQHDHKIKKHLKNRGEKCIFYGGLKVTNITDSMHSYGYYDVQCIYCGVKSTSYIDRWKRNKYKVGDFFLKPKKNWTNEIVTGCIFAFSFLLVATVILSVNAADKDTKRKVNEAKSKHSYVVGEKATCNVFEDEKNSNSGRIPVPCTVTNEIDNNGYYVVKFNRPRGGAETTANIRILDMEVSKP